MSEITQGGKPTVKRHHPVRMKNIPLHIEGAATIEKLSFHEPWSASSLELLTKDGIGVGYLCTEKGEDGEEVVTAYGGMLITVDEGQITNIATHPDHRNKGLGLAVMRALLRHAKDEKLDSVSLEVRVSNAPALAVYKKAGFVEVGRRKNFYTKPTEDALIMEARLK